MSRDEAVDSTLLPKIISRTYGEVLTFTPASDSSQTTKKQKNPLGTLFITASNFESRSKKFYLYKKSRVPKMHAKKYKIFAKFLKSISNKENLCLCWLKMMMDIKRR